MAQGVSFCEPVERWFSRRFDEPTDAQAKGWPVIARGHDTLISAPTGSGKTLAAFLLVLDRLTRRGMRGMLMDQVEAVYISPLRALSHDIQRNLETPSAEIREEAHRLGIALPEIRSAVRTGDTPAAQRQSMLRRPPHILVTTPESLFLLLTAERSRNLLRSVRTVIVDEIHALARDKRGSHLALSLARLDALCEERPVRLGLSATQHPIEVLARFLVGSDRSAADGSPLCEIVDLGHQRNLDLAIEVPQAEDLHAVAPHEQWEDLLESLSALIGAHRTTLVFVNTRRLAERLAHRLGERVGTENVAAHHGSLSRERRLGVEARLRDGSLRALVATASLELGIDIGSIDLAVQIGSPRSIATFLQRVGRSGHALGLVPKGRLFPTTRDELMECAAIVRAIRAGRLDRIEPPVAPLDILAQQLVAACACEEWEEEALFELVRNAAPYAELKWNDYDAVLEMLATGFETPRGRRAVYLHRDRLRRRLRGRRFARMASLTSGGAIPETGDYRVILDPEETFLGTVNEDWAVESMAGDVFLLGTHSWRIRRVENGIVRVTDAQGAPPTIPFWLGEAPARTEELSGEVSSLRAEIAERIGHEQTRRWLEDECALPSAGAEQLIHYIESQLQATGHIPTREELLAERFFDEAGGMQLVLHSPYGARINRGLGLALRKRFCRSFNIELQAAATDDALVLSLGNPQTFPLESLPKFLSSATIEDTLTQAFLGSPLFTTRWRWNATRSLAVLRMRGGKRVPFPLQRMQADDLLVAAFPEQVACQENVSFPIQIPEHPLVQQTLYDCLHEAADLDGTRALLERIEKDEVSLHVLDTVEASPFTHEILNARPYAFLDDAPLEERRTRAVALRHVLPDQARDLARLEPEAIARVRSEAEPVVRDADELYELLVDLVVARKADLPQEATPFVDELLEQGRAAWIQCADVRRLFALERLVWVRTLFPEVAVIPDVELPAHMAQDPVEIETARDGAVRGHLATLGPVTPEALAVRIGLDSERVFGALVRLESVGIALRGEFDPELADTQFCDRSLLARIHRYTLARLRREIEPTSARDFIRFLLRWQHLDPETQLMGEGGVERVIEQLSGFEAAAAAWESELLAARIDGYKSELLDALCLGGLAAWGRLSARTLEAGSQPSRATPIALFPRAEMNELLHAAAATGDTTREPPRLRGPAQRILALLRERGALFARELEAPTGLLPLQLEEGLKELVANGLVSCDGFAPLRRLLTGAARTSRRRPGRPGARARGPAGPEGRWGLIEPIGDAPDREAQAEATAQRLLQRYGVVFRDLLAREWLPVGWREVHRALRRFEARGTVRGGRFVAGFIGEQFALPEAIPLLRKERSRELSDTEIRVSAADPLNLAGILTPGPRVPAGHTRWLVYRNGLPIATIERGRRSELIAERIELPPGAVQLETPIRRS